MSSFVSFCVEVILQKRSNLQKDVQNFRIPCLLNQKMLIQLDLSQIIIIHETQPEEAS